MKKIILLMFLFVFASSIELAAENKLIISDGDVNETLMRNDFTYRHIDSIFLDHEKLSLLMERLEDQVYQEPVNATLDDSWTIVPEEVGQSLDRHNFIRFFYEFFYSDVSFEMKVPKKVVYPRVDTELLSDISSNEIGNYLTYFRASNRERSHNIQLAAKAINNHVVFPGETFSFNEVVGKRTVEKGYKRAPVIVKGELSEDIGGGICQVSSTLFNAVSLKGIKIVERYSHSRAVPYVPPGKDATVSWWGPDFIFKNEYSHPILIRAKAKDGQMVVRIFTSDFATANRKRDGSS
ncbi:VanW family protein [Paucisalibacillus sp. EB02]|uniref:VanW family protein n=1 Tax=Paucisalibacillus sp. EB02 TaxID=1347087 RepID=UPI0004ADFDBA|nr:VanW family protein [Paucisalibacillus sp. EB02]